MAREFGVKLLSVNLCSGNGLVSSDNKPLLEPMLIQIYITVVNTAVKLYWQVRQRDIVGYCWLLCVCEAGRHFHYLYKFDAQLKKYIL